MSAAPRARRSRAARVARIASALLIASLAGTLAACGGHARPSLASRLATIGLTSQAKPGKQRVQKLQTVLSRLATTCGMSQRQLASLATRWLRREGAVRARDTAVGILTRLALALKADRRGCTFQIAHDAQIRILCAKLPIYCPLAGPEGSPRTRASPR